MQTQSQKGRNEGRSAGNNAPAMNAYFESADDRGLSEPTLLVDVAGFEGPLDLLLHLSRNQKVDLAQISVVALVDQYLDFIRKARDLRLELAADYLVMAAWLAFLKSKLLIPKPKDAPGESGEDLAALLQFRLKRLEAIRTAGEKLINRDRLGRDFFSRGLPEAVIMEKKSEYTASLFDLLASYARNRQRTAMKTVRMERRAVFSLKEARTILTRLIGETHDWLALDQFLIEFLAEPEERRSAIASTFAASLELVRERQLEIRQDHVFAPIYMRHVTPAARAAMPPNENNDPK